MHVFFAVLKTAESELKLFLMLEVMNEIFSEAHSWCFDGLNCMLTWSQQLVLSRFHAAVMSKAQGFNLQKEAGTLKTNFDY